jgi:hypothetical protein
MKRTTRKPTSSTSKARSYEEIGEYWDAHDLATSEAGSKAADFAVDIQQRRFLVAIEPTLFAKVRRRAAKQGLSAERLLNLWVQEKCAASR